MFRVHRLWIVRNRHRTNSDWSLRSVAAILANPRYTGRQVWNRHRTDHNPDPRQRDVVRRRNPCEDWVISSVQAHPGLVSEADFVAAQLIRARRRTDEATTRTYLLTGVLQCGVCARRMDAHWVNQRPGYRCRHGHTSATGLGLPRARNLYVREDHVLRDLSATFGYSGRPDELVDYLRAEGITVICPLDRPTATSG